MASPNVTLAYRTLSPVQHSAATTRDSVGVSASPTGARPAQVCYSQPSNGNGVVSQYVGNGSPYNTLGADDFTLGGTGCSITSLTVSGFTGNMGTVVGSFNVTFYYDSGSGQPGSMAGQPMSIPWNGTFSGSYALPLPGAGFVAQPNTTYWVSVQAVNVSAGDVWYWSTANIQGNPAVWQNPGGGFGVCPTWAVLASCVGVNDDFAFDLNGVALPPGPCYSQLRASSKPVNSQRPPGMGSAKTTEAADDFTLRQPCTVHSVDVFGVYVGSGSATDFKVTFYKDAGGMPDPSVVGTSLATIAINGHDFTLTLASPVSLLAGPTYWVSVQARGMSNGADKWLWYTRGQIGNPAYWRNNGFWYGSPCTNWVVMQSCHIPNYHVAPDLAFSINP
jgi:hypothetical protein